MDHSAPFLDNDTDQNSLWPWVIGLLATLGLFLATAQTINAIPSYISANARAALVKTDVTGVSLSVDGRDVIVSGTISPDVDKPGILDALANAPGVRTVADELAVFDPAKAAQERTDLFKQRLGQIDISPLAFEPSSAALTTESLPTVDRLTQLLLQYPEQRVRIAGHTDNTGRPAVNLRISRERADAVAQYITSRGVATSQVVARGFGASRPIADNSTDDGRARNRRIEITHIK